jgi:hypothetical protein
LAKDGSSFRSLRPLLLDFNRFNIFNNLTDYRRTKNLPVSLTFRQFTQKHLQRKKNKKRQKTKIFPTHGGCHLRRWSSRFSVSPCAWERRRLGGLSGTILVAPNPTLAGEGEPIPGVVFRVSRKTYSAHQFTARNSTEIDHAGFGLRTSDRSSRRNLIKSHRVKCSCFCYSAEGRRQ